MEKLGNILDSVALSKDEIEAACRRGFLPQNLDYVLTHTKESGGLWGDYSHDIYDNEVGLCNDIQLTVPVKPHRGARNDWSGDANYLFTHYYMIMQWTGGYKGDPSKNGGIVSAEYLVIPLEKVEYAVLSEGNCVGGMGPIYTESKKSPVAGAVVGGIIAGPAGAVVGAVANQGTKRTMLTAGVLSYEYTMTIKFVGNSNVWNSRIFEVVGRSDKKTDVDFINQRMRTVIASSKGKVSNQQKADTVTKSMNAGKTNKIAGNVGVWILGAIFVAAWVAFLIWMNNNC